MAVLEYINYQRMIFEPSSTEAKFGFIPDNRFKPTHEFPQIYFSNGEPWKEANQFAFYRMYDSSANLKTVTRELNHLSKYACWLEVSNIDWLHFPLKKRDRCLYQFRVYLIECRESNLLAPSTISQIMSVVVKFYRWANAMGLVSSSISLWKEQVKNIHFFDKLGFSRTLSVTSTDLSIPNRARGGILLEGGLTPLLKEQVKILMVHLGQHQNYEMYLLHKVALLTGCRFETITTLTIDVLENSYKDHNSQSQMRVRVGPGTRVKTKFNVSGEILFPNYLVNELINYFESSNAILRRSLAKQEDKNKIFLTNRGNPYNRNSFSTLIKRLRDELIKIGHSEFKRFKFHQLRATFGTMLMRAALNSVELSKGNAIEYVKAAMLHKDASTTWKYIKFIENEPIQEEFHKLLWQLFTNEENNSNELIDKLTGRYDA